MDHWNNRTPQTRRRLETLDRIRAVSLRYSHDDLLRRRPKSGKRPPPRTPQTKDEPVNPRKEFFKVDLALIAQIVEEKHGKVEFEAEPKAEEYLDSVLEPLAGVEVE